MNALFDIQYTLRKLFNTPGFTAITIAVMAVGLGISIYIISVVNTLRFAPLDFEDGSSLIRIGRMVDGRQSPTLLHDYHAILEESNSYELLTGYQPSGTVVTDGTQSIFLFGIWTAQDFFKYTQVEPILGRTFNPTEHIVGALDVAVISYELWQSFFNGAPNIIGQTITVNREQQEIIGVMPEGFLFPLDTQVWLPLRGDPKTTKIIEAPVVLMLAKLRPGVTLEQAQLELDSILANNTHLKAHADQDITYYADSYKRFTLRHMQTVIYLLLVSGLIVLALSCINVGNLLLARSNKRAKETAIRMALGASRGRLIRQTVLESIVICAFGCVLALLLAGWALEITDAFFESRIQVLPYWINLELSPRDIALGTFVTVIAITSTGLIPAIKSTQGNFNAVIQDGSKTALGRGANKTSKILVAVEVILSCAILMVASVQYILINQALSKGYGFNIDNFLVASVNPQSTHYPEDADRIEYFNKLYHEVTQMAGVKSATLLSTAPTQSWAFRAGFEPEGQDFPNHNYPKLQYYKTYPGAFKTLGVPVLEGRTFTLNDDLDNLEVAIISEDFAKRTWPGESAIGKRIRRINNRSGEPRNWLTIVGVVPNIAQANLASSERYPKIYVPYMQMAGDRMTIILKTNSDPYQHQGALAKILAKLDPNTPMYQVQSMAFQAKMQQVITIFVKNVFSVFALVTLLMASTGIYAVTSNQVQQRTQELGIRRALGANKANILTLLFRHSLYYLVPGFTIGVPMGWLMSQHFVKEIGAGSIYYVLAYVLVPLAITGIVFLATLIPGRRVLKLQPSCALRHE